MLLQGQTKPPMTYTLDIQNDDATIQLLLQKEAQQLHQLCLWCALEQYDPYVNNAYAKEPHVYALGFLFTSMIDFWKVSVSHYFQINYTESPDY